SLGLGSYFISQNRAASEGAVEARESLVAEFRAELSKQADDFRNEREELEQTYQDALDRQDKRLEGWNGQLTGALQKFDADAQSMLKQLADTERQASEERQTTFRQYLADLPTGPSRAAVANDAGAAAGPDLRGPAGESPSSRVTSDQPQPAVSNGSAPSEAVASAVASAGGAVLRLANTVMRPTSAEGIMITLRNETDEEALVERVRFVPQKDFKAPDASILADEVSRVTTFRYSAADNTSQRPGYHGVYDHRLSKPLRIPARDSVTLRMVIADPSHAGWGLAGQLTIDYNARDKSPLVVNEAHLVFQ
ncbi:MAG: hypothetical protein ACKO23_02435, partial [Gemmataceae bacterium]